MVQPVKPRVLVVDDHPANRLAREVVLENDYTVYLAASGKEAIEMAEMIDFAVILLDVRMPILDGFETAAELRRRERTRHTPILFTSAFDKSIADVHHGFDSGATDYLFSPIEPEYLKFKVATHCQAHLRQEALRERIEHLGQVAETLRTELHEALPVASALRERIRELEGVIEEMSAGALA
jgi:PleD family two-component response regulator